MKKFTAALAATAFLALPALAQTSGAQTSNPAPEAQGDKPTPTEANQSSGTEAPPSADKPAGQPGAQPTGGEGGDKPAEAAVQSPN